jgi:hypothetical protein
VVVHFPGTHRALGSTPSTANHTHTREEKGETADNKKIAGGQRQWLTPVILATQEAEIRGLQFEASLGK